MPTLQLDDSALAASIKPKKWYAYQDEIYDDGKTSEIGFNLDNLEEAAKKVLHPGPY